jgi:iron complex outermembrane recepter protein
MKKSATKSFQRRKLASCFSIPVLPIVIASQALAESPNLVLEEVTVTGSAAANRAAIAVKENSQQIMDAFSADDIGALPELNIADSFRRIPGLNTINDSDEGQFVTIRGVDAGLNFVTFDGMAIATDQENSRKVNMEAIPSSSVSGLEVYKSLSPELDGNAIGGTLNMKSRSAYDNEGMFLQLSGDLSSYSLDQTPDDDDGIGGDIDITFSNTFGGEDQFGVMLAAKYANKNRDEMKWDPRFDWTNGGDPDAAFRKRFNSANYTNIWKTKGGLAKFEYNTDNVYAYLTGFYYEKEENEDTSIWSIDKKDSLTEDNFYEGGGGFTDTGRGELGFATRPTVRTNGGVHFHIDTVLSEDHAVSFDLSRSEASYSRPYFKSYWKTLDNGDPEGLAALAAMGYSYESNANHPGWQINDPAFASDAGNYFFDSIKDELTEVEDQVTEVKADYKFNVDNGSYGWGAAAGVKFRNNIREMDRDRTNYKLADGADDLTLDQFVDNGINFVPEYFNDVMPFMNYDAFESFYAQNKGTLFTSDQADIYKRGVRDDFKFDEEVTAAYGMARYATDDWTLSGGLRFEKTKVVNSGTTKTDNIYTPFHTESSYNDVLPSINFTYNITEDLRLRAAYSQSIGRPDPGDTKALQSISVSADDSQTDISKRNQDLKPRSAQSYDLSLEYYFSESDGVVALALFRKDIDDLIIGVTNEYLDTRVTVEGGTNVFTPEVDHNTYISQTKNADNATVDGIEVNFIMNRLEFLPGPLKTLGISTNATWLDAEMSYVDNEDERITIDHLVDQANFLANVALFYNFMDGRGEARVAYNYTDDYSSGLKKVGEAYKENIWEAFEQVDVQVRFDLTDNLSLRAKVRNLGDKPRDRKLGTDKALTEHEVYFGRSTWLGLTYTF